MIKSATPVKQNQGTNADPIKKIENTYAFYKITASS